MATSETPPPLFGDYYREIYAKGMLAGERPRLPMAWAELESSARESLMRDLSLELLGTRMPAPVLLAPIGVQTLLHEEGELAFGQGRGFGRPAAGHQHR